MREVLIGDLAYVQIATVLQMMENEQLSGWVQTRIGTVIIRGGLIVDIDVDGMPTADAMMHLIEQGQGGFIVEAGNPPRQPPLGTVPALLMQAAQLKDEWYRIRNVVYEPTVQLQGRLASLSPWLDGRRTLEEVLQSAGVHVSEAIDELNEAVHKAHLMEVADRTTSQCRDQQSDLVLAHDE